MKSQSLLLFLWNKRRVLIFITVGSALASLVISLLIKPLYLSSAIVFPAATSSVSFSEQRNAKAAAMDFGEEEQAEQFGRVAVQSIIDAGKLLNIRCPLNGEYKVGNNWSETH